MQQVKAHRDPWQWGAYCRAVERNSSIFLISGRKDDPVGGDVQATRKGHVWGVWKTFLLCWSPASVPTNDLWYPLGRPSASFWKLVVEVPFLPAAQWMAGACWTNHGWQSAKWCCPILRGHPRWIEWLWEDRLGWDSMHIPIDRVAKVNQGQRGKKWRPYPVIIIIFFFFFF